MEFTSVESGGPGEAQTPKSPVVGISSGCCGLGASSGCWKAIRAMMSVNPSGADKEAFLSFNHCHNCPGTKMMGTVADIVHVV